MEGIYFAREKDVNLGGGMLYIELCLHKIICSSLNLNAMVFKDEALGDN